MAHLMPNPRGHPFPWRTDCCDAGWTTKAGAEGHETDPTQRFSRCDPAKRRDGASTNQGGAL